MLIIKSKELAKAYIDNWNKHRKHSEEYRGNSNNRSSRLNCKITSAQKEICN
jgi:hypothetical protein